MLEWNEMITEECVGTYYVRQGQFTWTLRISSSAALRNGEIIGAGSLDCLKFELRRICNRKVEKEDEAHGMEWNQPWRNKCGGAEYSRT